VKQAQLPHKRYFVSPFASLFIILFGHEKTPNGPGFSKKTAAGKLFDFFVQGMTAQVRVVFLYLQAFGLQLFVAGGGITGNRLSFRLGFSAFQSNLVSHKG
jgi:hypothetical protein